MRERRRRKKKKGFGGKGSRVHSSHDGDLVLWTVRAICQGLNVTHITPVMDWKVRVHVRVCAYVCVCVDGDATFLCISNGATLAWR